MDELTLLMPGKINLSIDVTGKLENGYHTVEMIMQSIALYDRVTVQKKERGISISCSERYVPRDQRNIAWMAAEAFFSECREAGGAYITLKKQIPVAAGLAGGSTDAAGVLRALNLLYGKQLNATRLVQISRRLGADVAFCLEGGTQLAQGIGDELTVLPDMKGIHVVLVKPPFPVSTPWVYKNLKLDALGERPDTSGLINAIEAEDISFIARNMRNVLESVTVKEHPELTVIMEKLVKYGALGSRMSGSGPTVFGLFDDRERASFAKGQLSKEYQQVFIAETIGRGDVVW